MIRKLVAAALIALVAAPAVSLWQSCSADFGAPDFDFGGARQVSIGALVSTGLL